MAENYYSVQVTSMWVAGVEMAVGCAALNSPGPSILDSGTSSLMCGDLDIISNHLSPLTTPHATWGWGMIY